MTDDRPGARSYAQARASRPGDDRDRAAGTPGKRTLTQGLAPVERGPAAPMRKPLGHAAFEAQVNYALLLADRKGELVTAGAYVHFHMTELRRALGAFLLGRPLSPGAGVRFVEGRMPFLAQLGQSLDTPDHAHDVQVLRAWLAPLDLYAIVDRNRAVFEDGTPQPSDLTALSYAGGKTGPLRWCAAVALGIGSALEARLAGSMPRMAARLAAKTAEHRAANPTDPAPVHATELVPSSPLDWDVALAYCGRGGERPTVVVPAGPIQVDPGIQARNRDLKGLVWQGAAGGPWNAVKAPRTPDATTEDIAATVAGSSTEAYRIQRVGDAFVFPADMAALVPDAVRYRPAVAPPGGAIDQIALGKDGASAASAEAERALSRLHAAEVSAGPAHARAPVPSAGSLLQAWQAIHDQLDGLLLVCKPHGLGAPVGQAIAMHARRRADLATLAGHDALVRAQLFTSQHALLTEINLQAGDLATQLAAAGKASEASHQVVRAALQAIVRAASLSHLPQTGRAVLAEASQLRNAAAFEALEATLADAQARIEITRLNGEHGEHEQAASRSALGDGYAARADALRTRVAELRSQFLAGKPSAGAVKDLYAQIDALRFEVKLAAHLSSLRSVFKSLGELEDANWIVLSGGHGRLETRRVAAFELKAQLQAIHGRWLALENRARQVSAGLKVAEGGNPDALALEMAAPMLDALRAQLAALGGDQKVHVFLNEAYAAMKSAQHRAMILQIATLIGVAIAAAVTGGLAEGAALGLGGSQAGAMLAGMVVESTYFTAVSARLSGEPVAQAMASNVAGNLATLGALKGFDKLLGMTRIGKVLGAAAGGEAVGKGAYLAAKGAELTGRTLVAAGVQYAQAQYETMLHHGRTLTTDELVDAGVQGMGMMIGTAVLSRLARTPLQQIKTLGARGGRAVSQHHALEALAERVARTGNGADAVELLREERAALEAQVQLWHELAQETPAALAHRGLSPHLVQELGAGSQAHLAALDKLETGALPAQLGLEVTVPGRAFIGDARVVTSVISGYVERGYTVENVPREDGQVQYRVTGPHEQAPIEIIARKQSKPTEAPAGGNGNETKRVRLAGTDEALIAASDNVPPASGSLDVIIHGEVDSFSVKSDRGKLELDHRALAKYIEKSGARYKRIRLMSCSTGKHAKGAAQHLANKLGVVVEAPNDFLWIHPDGTMTIGPSGDRNTGRWVEYRPQKSESRYQVAPEPPPPTLRERLTAQKAATVDDRPSEPLAREVHLPEADAQNQSVHPEPQNPKRVGGADETHRIGLHDDRSAARKQESISQLANIPVARVSAGTQVVSEAAPLAHDTYYVSYEHGGRMLELLADLQPEVQTRSYKKGFIVRHDNDEWYFEFHPDPAKHGAAARMTNAHGIGLPPPNVATVELWGFRGIRTIYGRDRNAWTPDEHALVEEIKKIEPLLYAGHVGISTDGGKTIYGLTPKVPPGVTLEAFMKSLMAHDAYPGVVKDDTSVFRAAEKMSKASGWNTQPISAVELVDKPRKLEAVEQLKRMAGAPAGGHGVGYSFPLEQPKDGHHYQDSNGFCATDIANCAAFPPRVGVPVPEPSGNLKRFMPELDKWAQADGPIDQRTTDKTERP